MPTLRIHKPVFPLSQFVADLVYFDSPGVTHHLDRFLPDGNTEILIDLTDHAQHIYDNHSLRKIQTCHYAWVSGVRTRPITIPSGRGSRMLIIAFKKGKAFPFYRFPMSELIDTVVGGDLVFGTHILDIREQLLAAKSTEQMFQLVERFLLHQAEDSIQQNSLTRCVNHAVTSIIRHPTLKRLRQLSDEIGYSQKHFISLFRSQVGVSPKQYLRIMRFQRAVCAIENNQSIRWSQVAVESGFFDQAHFIHDFKHFSGFTPDEYVSRKTGTLNYIPVG